MLSHAIALLSISALAAASPLSKRAPTDTDILQYALTLEHLENAFYADALAKFDAAAFQAVNADRTRVEEISSHEAQHVAFLSAALGDSATARCNYTFPYTDVTSFIGLATVIENVGVSAYLGAAQYITDPAYLTAAASILTTEARHQAYLSTVSGGAPWSGPEDSPLDLSEVYSLVAPFITSCPSTNPTLPVKAFPSINVTTTDVTANKTISATFNTTGVDASATLYAAFISGLNTTFVPFTNNSTTVPNFNGTVYMIITSSNGNVTDDNTVAGPAILSLGGLKSNQTGFLQASGASSGSSARPTSTGGSSSSAASGFSLKTVATVAAAVSATVAGLAML